MEINDILSKLGIDLSNPDARRGAIEAIDAILASREPAPDGGFGGGSGGGGNTTEVELDPDLLQPSIKQTQQGNSDDDVEIEDEDDILSQIKHKDQEDPIDSDTNTSGNDSNGDNEKSDGGKQDSSKNKDKDGSTDHNKKQDNDKEIGSEHTPPEKDGHEETGNDFSNDDFDDFDDFDDGAEGDPGDFEDGEDVDGNDFGDEEAGSDDFGDGAGGDDDSIEGELDDGKDEADSDDEFDFDESDFVDNDLEKSAIDKEVQSKYDSRKIKRERTLTAAKKALADAQAKKVSTALIRELERAIEALEALTEAVTKSIKDISDAEFNKLINRVFDAIQACGDSSLTFSSEEERQAKVQEIKTDLANDKTRAELSAEDAAKIRAETQAVKAREKEAEKYKTRAANSFKGFQDFLTSLYKAIALQVATEETRDDTWSAISRRNSGAGVLRQGQKINDLPDKRIPIIDFYFDTSTSWTEDDLKVGMKAVSQLADMDGKGQIKLNIFYFADEVSTTPTRGSTSGWNEIVKNVIATRATNVVVMTDSDMQNWWYPGDKPPLRYTVPGYVWYLWKNGKNAPRLPQDLKGRGGVKQFSFNINDV